MKRRHFLQSAGSALAVLGLNQWEIQQQGLRYAQVIAQGTPRKLALLVGINVYPSPINPLQGCLTDVQLQRELLIHRFGFNPKDIVQVTDAQATRQGILTAFEEHLIKQAQPGDIVVFHFSGHGSQVSAKPECDSVAIGASDRCVNSTLVPQDSLLSGGTLEGGAVNDIMGHTLFLLMSALRTENVTAILDCCHSGGGTRGNFQVRAISRVGESESFLPSPAEKEYQQKWLSQLGLSQAEYVKRRRAAVAKGVVIAAARREQYAADVPFEGFQAGAFTYTMTRYLWQQTFNEGVGNSLVRISLSAKTQASLNGIEQDPLSEANPANNNDRPFFFLPLGSVPAEAVVTEVKGKQFNCWLGGVDGETINAVGNDAAQLAIVDSQGKEQGLVKLLSREGLIAKGELIKGTLSPGTLLQAKVVGIPNDLPLEIILDASLKPEETAIQQALQSIQRVKIVPIGQAGQYLLVRLTDGYRQSIAKPAGTNVPAVGSIGLLSPGGDRIITGSFGPANETAAKAIDRLRSQFTLLLANRLLQMLRNTDTSSLPVDVNVTPMGAKGAPIATVRTSRNRSASNRGNTRSAASSPPLTQQIRVGSKVQVKVINQHDKPLYTAILGIGTSGELVVLFPSDWNAPTDASLVNSKKSILIPRSGVDKFEFQIDGPPGAIQVMVLASVEPLRNAMKGLQQIASHRGMRSGALPLEGEAASAVEGLLGGLDVNTRGSFKINSTEHKAIANNQLAAISVALEVVE
ncbi:MAG: DUF4384 domain-containing protein [Acaryochloridaceae cyanobacterium CSU_3_4]|nr:DUF4384 domain-containing protein [Acaryochloridaceae cyanobacterium CSU_3_4]